MTTLRPSLLFLHGALGAGDQFARLRPLLDGSFELHTLEFEGHGAAPSGGRPYRIGHFVENVLGYLDDRNIARTHLFGYSMGGFVALRCAAAAPARVGRIATLGTIFRWNRMIAERELKFLDAEEIERAFPRFAGLLEGRHTACGWRTVVSQSRTLLGTLGEEGGIEPDAVRGLPHSVLIMVGERDTTADPVHSEEIARAMPHGRMQRVPGTPHPIERAEPELLAGLLMKFFGADND